MSASDETAIDELVGAFFAAFTNTGGVTPDVRRVYDLCIPSAVFVRSAGPIPEICSLGEFVEPRQALLSNGTLVDFAEVETSQRTDIVGHIAQRRSAYRKSGVLSGRRFETRGAKLFLCIRTAAGWRLGAVAWEDET